MDSATAAQKPTDNKRGFFLLFFFFFFPWSSPNHVQRQPSRFSIWCIRCPGFIVNKTAMRFKRNGKAMPNNVHKGAGGGGGGCSSNSLPCACMCPQYKHQPWQRKGAWGASPPLFFFWAHLSWQPYSASVKTRYRNVLWVTFKTRYKSSAL